MAHQNEGKANCHLMNFYRLWRLIRIQTAAINWQLAGTRRQRAVHDPS